GLPSGVGDLDARWTALPADEPDDARERVDVIIGPDPQILWADAAISRHGRRFGQYQRGSADCPASQMDNVPVRRKSVGARVLAHRGHEDAVRKRQTAQGEWIEEMGHGPIL